MTNPANKWKRASGDYHFGERCFVRGKHGQWMVWLDGNPIEGEIFTHLATAKAFAEGELAWRDQS